MTTRPAWYRPDRVLASRMVITMFLLGLVYVAFVLAIWQLTGGNILVYIFIAGIIAVIQFSLSDKIALWSMNAKEASEAEFPKLHAMIERLAQQANLPKPKVYYVETSVPNAFATGRNENNAVICVTTGIMQRLTDPEMESVLAHELTHIINRDMLVMTIATFFSMVIALLMRSFFYSMLFGGMGGGGRDRDNNNGFVYLAIYLLSLVAYVVSFLLIQGLSRYRELAADRGSALITGAPQNLASALMKISDTVQSGRIPDRDLRQAGAVNALAIIPAIKGDDIGELFSTHPSLQRRIAQLQKMQEQMENAPRIH